MLWHEEDHTLRSMYWLLGSTSGAGDQVHGTRKPRPPHQRCSSHPPEGLLLPRFTNTPLEVPHWTNARYPGSKTRPALLSWHRGSRARFPKWRGAPREIVRGQPLAVMGCIAGESGVWRLREAGLSSWTLPKSSMRSSAFALRQICAITCSPILSEPSR